MADVKISQLTAVTVPKIADNAVITTDVGGGTLATRKITFQNLLAFQRYDIFYVKCLKDSEPLVVGDGLMYFVVPDTLNNTKIVSVHAAVYTASTSGLPTARLRNTTKGVYVLSTNVTIDANEKTSYTAATQPVVNTSNNLLNTGDEMRVDITAAGTGTKGFDMIIKVDRLWA